VGRGSAEFVHRVVHLPHPIGIDRFHKPFQGFDDSRVLAG